MLSVRLPLKSRLLIVKFGGNQKTPVGFRLWEGLAQGQGCWSRLPCAACSPFPRPFPRVPTHPTTGFQRQEKPTASGAEVRVLTGQTFQQQVVSPLWSVALRVSAVTFSLSPPPRPRPQLKDGSLGLGITASPSRAHIQEGRVRRCVFMSGECFSLRLIVGLDLTSVWRRIFPRISASPPQQAYPHIFLASIQSHTQPKPITVRGEMDRHDGFKGRSLPEVGERLTVPENTDVQGQTHPRLLEEAVGMAAGWAASSVCLTWQRATEGRWREDTPDASSTSAVVCTDKNQQRKSGGFMLSSGSCELKPWQRSVVLPKKTSGRSKFCTTVAVAVEF